ncbi:MAG: DNA polymerase III subunit delta [Candidatus Zixiibacteriota bacterium]
MGFSEDRAKGHFGSFHLIVAENPYLLWEATEHWKSVWRREAPGAALRIFTAPHVEMDRLLELGTTVPLFETVQLIVVEQIDRLPAARQKELADIVSGCGPTTKILLTAESIDRRTSFYKTLANLGPCEVFPRIYQDDIPGWVKRLAGEIGWVLSPQATELISSVHGTDLFAVAQTLERVTLFIGQKRRIEVGDIETVIAGDGEHDIYLLIEALIAGELQRSLGIVNSLLSSGDRTFLWLTQVQGQCMRLFRLLDMADKTDHEAGQSLGIHHYLVRRLRPLAAALGRDGLTAVSQVVFETDWAMKSSLLPPRLAWELFVWRLAGENRRGEIWFDLNAQSPRE